MADTNTSGDSKRPRLSLRPKKETAPEETQVQKTQPIAETASKAANDGSQRASVSVRHPLRKDGSSADKGPSEASKPTTAGSASSSNGADSKPRLNLKLEAKPEVAATPSSQETTPTVTPSVKKPVAKAPPPIESAKTIVKAPVASAKVTPPPLPTPKPAIADSTPAAEAVKPKSAVSKEEDVDQDAEVEATGGHGPFLTLFIILAVIIALGGGVYYLATSGSLAGLAGSDGKDQSISAEAPATPNQNAAPGAGPGGIFQRVDAVTDKVAANVALYDEVTVAAPASAAGNAPTGPLPGTATPQPQISTRPSASRDVEFFLAKMTVTMVRTSSDGARIMVDDVIYHQGDVLDPTSGLTLVGADSQNKQLIFRDGRGISYRKDY